MPGGDTKPITIQVLSRGFVIRVIPVHDFRILTIVLFIKNNYVDLIHVTAKRSST